MGGAVLIRKTNVEENAISIYIPVANFFTPERAFFVTKFLFRYSKFLSIHVFFFLLEIDWVQFFPANIISKKNMKKLRCQLPTLQYLRFFIITDIQSESLTHTAQNWNTGLSSLRKQFISGLRHVVDKLKWYLQAGNLKTFCNCNNSVQRLALRRCKVFDAKCILFINYQNFLWDQCLSIKIPYTQIFLLAQLY